MDELEKLRRELEQAKASIQAAKKHSQEVEKRNQEIEKHSREVEKRNREVEKRNQEVEKRNQEVEKHSRKVEKRNREVEKYSREVGKRVASLKLGDFLKECHTLALALVPITERSLTTQGETTKPAGRLHPLRIVPWKNFPAMQAHVWDTLAAHTSFFDKAVFPSLEYLERLKSTLPPVSSEMTLRSFQCKTVEDSVCMLMAAVHNDLEARNHLGLQGTISFIDHTNIGDPIPLEAQSMQRLSLNPDPRTPIQQQPKRMKNCRADQFCIYQSSSEEKVPTLAIEYKPPHKLTRDEIVTGLVGEIQPARDVINKSTETFTDAAKRLSAAVITQLFSYMVDKKLRYGFVCQGEAYIFLHISDDPSLVYYFVSVPSLDVPSGSDKPPAIYQTAVAQVSAFIMQAIKSQAPSQHWCDQAARLPQWCVEYEMEVHDIPSTIRSDTSAAVEYTPQSWSDMSFVLSSSSDGSSSPDNSSPLAAKSRCRPQTRQTRRENHQDDEEDEAGSRPTTAMSSSQGTPEPRLTRSQSDTLDNKTSGRGPAQGNRNRATINERPYCTHDCLKGLAFGGPLDSQCPNAADHGHAHLGIDEFLYRTREQLASDRGKDADCTPLHVSGSRGSLFKLRLSSHGYTLVAKGVEAADRDQLLHENEIYNHLHDLQGRFIPVCLSTIDLILPYYYDGGIYMHFMLMSYAGRPVLYRLESIKPAIAENIMAVLSHLHEHRVLHRDAELRNVLYDDRTENCMMVDLMMSEVHMRQPSGGNGMDVKNEWRRKQEKDGFAREMQSLRGTLDHYIKTMVSA
ncbi:Protein kinase domain-containing protein [Fusarium sp. LHS14.1]|nr:Protein kinase domain-containing protein [Fusarium sp. LHS14.1]